ncbi:CCA tRNA nucleotidyltransferase [Clostridium perfringens]|nr:CCA tRNA nucleotidyltransferase [Clostridium perfringens]
MQINIPRDVQYILNKLDNSGYKAYVVGGCVRDSLLNLTPKDWDICTNAKPEILMEIFKEYNIIPTGLKHGTITVMINNIGYEITTFRKENDYDDKRRPKSVEFIDDLKEDLSRRDFTINAMAYNPKEGIIDPFHGKDDLIFKTIRVVCVNGEMISNRFKEDPLRVLRAYRFAARYGFIIDEWTLKFGIQAIRAKDYESLSIERIREEFNKILLHDPRQFMYMGEIFDVILPGFNLMYTEQNNPYHIYSTYTHTFKAVLECYDSLELRLAALLHDIGKYNCKTTDEDGIDHFYGHAAESVIMAERYLQRLKYDNKTIDTVLTLIKYHDCELNSKKSIKRLLNKIGEDKLKLLLDLKAVDILAQNPIYKDERIHKLWEVEEIINEIKDKQECFSIKDLVINGNDLIEIGIPQGKKIGEYLNICLEKVIEDPGLNSKEALLKIIENKL